MSVFSRKFASAGVVLAVGASLLGVGVHAAMTDSATATEAVNVGRLACTLYSDDSHAVISPDGHTVTINMPDIVGSTSGNYLANVKLTNSGTMSVITHWEMTKSGDANLQAANKPADLDSNSALAPGANATYVTGFMWPALNNADLGQSASVTYPVTCSEVPPPAASHVQFIGFANAAGHAALTLPSGAQPGDLAVVLGYGSTSSKPGTPAGYTSLNSTVQEYTNLSQRVLVAGDTAVPATTAGLGRSVAVYRGATGVGANTYQNTSNGLPPESPNYPLYAPALSSSTASGPLHKIDASSWVGVMSHDTGNGTGDIRLETFNKVLTLLGGPPSYSPPTFDGSITTNRSAGAADNHTGLADTNGGVTNWANGTLLAMGGWVMPVSSTNHQTETYSFEILSQ